MKRKILFKKVYWHSFIIFSQLYSSFTARFFFSRTLGLNTDQILVELESGSGSVVVDVVFLPPESDAISGGDSSDNEDTLPNDINHLGRGTLSQQAELIIYDAVDELPAIIVGDNSLPSVMNDELEWELSAPAKRPHHGQAQELAVAEEKWDEEEQDEEQSLLAGQGSYSVAVCRGAGHI
jgi:hypothetical protein